MNSKDKMVIQLDTPFDKVRQEPSVYRLDWSDAMNKCPDWFRDAKFGLFFHWGPYTVPEFDNEWYSRNMYITNQIAHKHHEEHYGPVSRFGYKNFYEMFKGERFDPDAWVKLFAGSGAQYFTASAEHADGFAMWDSRVNPCNSMNYGLNRDVIRELKSAADRQGMRFGASLHHGWNWGWFCSDDPYADVYNPDNEIFYGKAVPLAASSYVTKYRPDKAFQENWLEKCKEVIDGYLPDIIYFDSRIYLMDEEYRLEFARYYLEAGRKAGKEVVFTYKGDEFKTGSGILDYECDWMDEVQEQPFQCDDKSMWGSWSYVKGRAYKKPGEILHQMIDVVSKNGNFLLNLGPKPDGTFDEETVSLLKETGNWLKINGEAIYGTRPFKVYGEGPARQSGHVAFAKDLIPYTPEDIRFTQKDGAVYALLLGWPFAGRVSIRTLRKGGDPEGHFGKDRGTDEHFGKDGGINEHISKITMLGNGEPLQFVQDATALTVTLPKQQPCKDAFVLKIE